MGSVKDSKKSISSSRLLTSFSAGGGFSSVVDVDFFERLLSTGSSSKGRLALDELETAHEVFRMSL